MKKKFAFLLAGAMLMTAALAGCGGDSADNTTEDVTPPAAGDSATPTIDAIREKGEIIMLTNAQFPPFEYLDDAGNVVGVDPDIAQVVADSLGVKLKVVDMDFDGIVDALRAGKGDFAAAGMTITPERQEKVAFTNEYVTSAQMVVIPKGSKLTADDAALSGKNIAVQEGTTGDWYADGDSNTGSQIKDANVLRFKSTVEAGMAVAQGKADAMIVDEMPATAIVASMKDELELLPTKLTDEKYAFAVQKDQDDLVDAINTILEEYTGEKVNDMLKSHMGVE